MSGQTLEIPLTQGQVALVDAADFEWLNQWKWSVSRQGRDKWRAVRWDGSQIRRAVLMHRMITAAAPGQTVDHINGDPLDNRRANLRIATQAEQNMNRRPSLSAKSSRFKGVCWHKGGKRWMAIFRRVYLGLYDREEDAALAYDRAALAFSPEFARLNFPIGG